MLSGQVLNSQATTNNFIVIGTKNFIPGEQFTLFFRVINPDLGIRYIQPSTSKPTITFNNLDGTTFTKTLTDVTIDANDRSIMSVVIEESESEDLASGTFTFELDILGDATQITKGVIENGLSRVLNGSGC